MTHIDYENMTRLVKRLWIFFTIVITIAITMAAVDLIDHRRFCHLIGGKIISWNGSCAVSLRKWGSDDGCDTRIIKGRSL